MVIVLLQEMYLWVGFQEGDKNWFENICYILLCIQIAIDDDQRDAQAKWNPTPHLDGHSTPLISFPDTWTLKPFTSSSPHMLVSILAV